MKIRPSIAYFALGIFFMIPIAEFALRMNDEQWKMDAVSHHCGVWRAKFDDPRNMPYFQWLDDYLLENREIQQQPIPPKNPDTVRF